MRKTKRSDRVLAFGEVTGHSHKVAVDVFDREDGLKEFAGETVVTHEEHKKIALPRGEYLSGQVQEFDYLEQQMRQVAD
jgi:uncharacterized phosphosugar-binding protein